MTVWILSFAVGWLWLSSAIAHYCEIENASDSDNPDWAEGLARIIAALVLGLAAPIILAVLVIKHRRNAAND